MRKQSHEVGDVAFDEYGEAVLILAVHHDPHHKDFGHCCGTSARYDVRVLSTKQQATRWDWQLDPRIRARPVEPSKPSWLGSLFRRIRFLLT